MRSLNIWALAAIGTSTVSSIELAPRAANPRVVGINVEKRSVTDIVARDRARTSQLLKRQNTVSQTLDNEQLLYYANISLGTPPQPIRVGIDTGSSDLWVNVRNSTFCADQTQQQCIGGTYDPEASSSTKFVNADFNVSYLDGSGAVGNYLSDTLEFGGVTVDNFQFGVGLESASLQGVLGIGYAANEAQLESAGDQTYPNLPQALLNAGFINRNAYSLWLNDLDASTGVILFGGVNRAKYQGELQTIPVPVPRGGIITHFFIPLTTFGYNGSAVTSSNLPTPVILDSGSTLSYIPDDIAAAIYDMLGVMYMPRSGTGLIDCSYGSSDAYLEFGFAGAIIQVPFNELVLDLGPDENGQAYTFADGTPACLFGIAPSGGVGILGDTFLRSAYVVYDLELNEVSLAQTVFNATGDDIVEIASGTAPVPGATPVQTTISSYARGTATDSAIFGPMTGLFSASGANPTAVATSTASVAATNTRGSSSSSSANAAYQTRVPFVAGALLAGAGLFL